MDTGDAKRQDLFPGCGIPLWLDDEILFSLASRYHHLSGNPSPHVTSSRLFGSSKVGYQHDLPSGIGEFARITMGTLGTAHEIIRNHTILPYYLPLRTQRDAKNAYVRMTGSSVGSLKYQLGILTSRFRAYHPLKVCPKCLVEDKENNLVAYWHRSHQFPGVWVCLKHKCFLSTSTVKSGGVDRFGWVLPREKNIKRDDIILSRQNDALLEVLIKLAKASIALAALPEDFFFNCQQLLASYHNALSRANLRTEQGNLRLHDISSEYLLLSNVLRCVPEMSALPGTLHEASSQLGRLFRQPRSGTHPIRHLTTIIWLFGDWEKFWTSYSSLDTQNLQAKGNADKSVKSDNDQGETMRQQLASLVRDKGYSVSSAAREIGISPTTAITWMSQIGFQITPRPKKLTSELRAKIVDQIKRGLDKSVIAENCHISQVTVSRMMRNEIGLQQQWLDGRFQHRLVKERKVWGDLIRSHGHLGVKVLRMLKPASYAWLYRHDNAWLQDVNKALPKVLVGNNSNVDWIERDKLLSAGVEKIALEWSKENFGKNISIAQICDLYPELKAKLERLDRLPLTYKVLERVVGRKFRRKRSRSQIYH